MSKKLFIFIFLWLSLSLNAFESSVYAKIGAIYPPSDSIVLPTVGLGVRLQKDAYGFDLSANMGSLIFFNYFSIKGLFLYSLKEPIYIGFGPGLGFNSDAAPMGQPHGIASGSLTQLTAEAVLGYEFRQEHHLKPFIQLELSQPAITLKRHKSRSSYRSGASITCGMRF